MRSRCHFCAENIEQCNSNGLCHNGMTENGLVACYLCVDCNSCTQLCLISTLPDIVLLLFQTDRCLGLCAVVPSSWSQSLSSS